MQILWKGVATPATCLKGFLFKLGAGGYLLGWRLPLPVCLCPFSEGCNVNLRWVQVCFVMVACHLRWVRASSVGRPIGLSVGTVVPRWSVGPVGRSVADISRHPEPYSLIGRSAGRSARSALQCSRKVGGTRRPQRTVGHRANWPHLQRPSARSAYRGNWPHDVTQRRYVPSGT